MNSIKDIFYIDGTGIKIPDLQTVINFFVENYKQVYGKDIVLTSDTQDGQWLAIQAQALYDTMQLCGALYNSFSPSTALADALDRNVRLNGIRRKIATKSTVDIKIIGVTGTVITSGQVKDIYENVWNLPQSVIIPQTGEITVTATAQNDGAIQALPNTVNIINTPTRGWQSVNNSAEGTVGAPVETDADLRRRQAISVSLPSQTVLEGIVGAIANLTGVTRYKGYENDTSETDSNGITPHSNCIVVEGGEAQEIAKIIALKKTAGSGTFGNTEIEVTDKYGLVDKIKFSRPIYNKIKVKVTIKALAGYSNTYAIEMKERITQYINSLAIGDTVYLARIYAPILACNTSNTNTFDVLSVEIAKDDDTLASANIEIAYNAVAQTDDGLIEIVTDGD